MVPDLGSGDLTPGESSFPFKASAADAAAFLKLLANEHRLLVLCYLEEEGELTVGQLTQRVGLSQSALSQHLSRLRADGLAATRREAQTIYYRVADAKTEQVLRLLHDLFCPELGRAPPTSKE